MWRSVGEVWESVLSVGEVGCVEKCGGGVGKCIGVQGK